MSSYGETHRINPQKTKTRMKMKDAKKYRAIYCMTCRIGCRSSERIWSMNVILQSHGETLSLDIKTLPVLLMYHQWSREQEWNQVRQHSVFTHFPKDPNCDICLKTKTTRASCRRLAGTVVPRAEHSGDLITAGHKILSEESESRNNHRYAVEEQDWATQWLTLQKNIMKFLEPDRKARSLV